MYCPKCGTPLPDESKFCGFCGTKIESNQPNSDTDTQLSENTSDFTVAEGATENITQAPAEGESEALEVKEESFTQSESQDNGFAVPEFSKKKKFHIPKKILGALSAVALAAVIIFSAPFMKGFFMKVFASPENYLEYVFQKGTKASLDSALSAYSSLLDTIKKQESAAKTEFEVTLGEKGIELIEDVLDSAGIDASLKKLNRGGVKAEINSKDKKTSVSAELVLADKQIVTLELILDAGKGDVYMCIPELNEKWIKTELPMSEFEEMAELDYEKLYKSLPSEKQVKKLFENYFDVIVENLGDVEKGREKVSVDGVEQKLTTLTVEIDEEVVADIMTAFANEAKNDDNLKEIVVEFANGLADLDSGFDYDGDEAWDEIESLFDEAQDIDEDYFGEIDADVVFYVNSKHEIAGFEVSVDGEEIFSSVQVEKGKEVRYEAVAWTYMTLYDGKYVGEYYDDWDEIYYYWDDVGDEYESDVALPSKIEKVEVLSVEGEGTKKGNKYTMEFDVKPRGADKITFEIIDFDVEKSKGTVRLPLKQFVGMMGAALFDYDLDMYVDLSSEKKTELGISLTDDDKLIVSAIIKSKIKKPSKVKLPDSNDVFLIEEEKDIEDWAESITFEKLKKNIEKLKLEGDLKDLVEDALEEAEEYVG